VWSKIREKVNLEADRQKVDQNPQYGSIVRTKKKLWYHPKKTSQSCEGQFVFYREAHQTEQTADVFEMNVLTNPDFSVILKSLHKDLGSFRYHSLMDILIASEYKRTLGDTGLPLESVISAVLTIELKVDKKGCSSLFNIDTSRKGKKTKKILPWLKFSPDFVTWQKNELLQQGDNRGIKSLLPNEERGHSILHAHCVTKKSYSETALYFHIEERRDFNIGIMKKTTGSLEIVGNMGSKLRLLAAFCQCIFFLPAVFDVPWPQALLDLVYLLQIFTTDFLPLLMNLSCRLRADYFSFFLMKMMVIPVGIAIAWIADRVALRCVRRNSSCCTDPSDLFFETVDFIIYMSYAQVCSSLFMYFRCRPVQDQRYLAADMRIPCDRAEWSINEGWAIFFIFLYMIGIPVVQFLVLCCNRRYLHQKNDKPKRHDRVQRRYGTLYKEFTDSCWWVRPVEGMQRLALTGGVVLFGDYTVSRLLGGIFVSVVWLVLLVHLHPYRARLDNLLAMLLSLELILTLVVGMALELYKRTNDVVGQTPKDTFQSDSFGFLLFMSNATII
jgi:hypothetical protein